MAITTGKLTPATDPERFYLPESGTGNLIVPYQMGEQNVALRTIEMAGARFALSTSGIGIEKQRPGTGYEPFVRSMEFIQEYKQGNNWIPTTMQPQTLGHLELPDGTVRITVGGVLQESPSTTWSLSWAMGVGTRSYISKFTYSSPDNGTMRRFKWAIEFWDDVIPYDQYDRPASFTDQPAYNVHISDMEFGWRDFAGPTRCELRKADQSVWVYFYPNGVNGNLVVDPGVDFDSSSVYADVSHHISLDMGGNDVTFDCWIKFHDWGEPNAEGGVVFVKGDAASPANGYYAFINRNIWTHANENRLGTSQYEGGYTTIGETADWGPTEEVWYHIAMVMDDTGNVSDFFVDGVKQSGPANTVTISSGNTQDGRIALARDGNHPSEAELDEMRISDIDRYGGSNFTPPTAPYTSDGNTVALWHMDENTGTSMADGSSNSNTATLSVSNKWSAGYPWPNSSPRSNIQGPLRGPLGGPIA
jgi:hypothetical protein